MELLLLFSAFMAALTGAITGTRVPQAAVATERSTTPVQAQVAIAVRPVATHRPVMSDPPAIGLPVLRDLVTNLRPFDRSPAARRRE